LNVILTLLTGGPLFEEPGWRGFALPRLQDRYGPLVGTLILGLLWAVWHLPFYFIPGWADLNGGLSLASLSVFGLSALAIAIILTWVFDHTRGSLLLAMLVHASLNTFRGYGNRLFPDRTA
jgi:membrane protease YdiL (CAAX protease family)